MKSSIIRIAATGLLILSGCVSSPVIKTGSRPPKKSIPSVSDSGSSSNSIYQSVGTPNQPPVNPLPPTYQTAEPEKNPLSPQLVDQLKQIHAEQQKTFEKPVSQENFPVNSKKIGVILPFTGKNSSVSQRLLDSVRMGLGLKNSSGSPSDFSIVMYDSQGSPELAAAGVEKLLRDDQVIAIIGGLGAKEASSIATKADYFQVPFFAFSQKSDLTSDTSYTFRNAITPGMQVNKLVDFAVNVLKAKRLAILYPNDAYGIEFANAFWDYSLAAGASIVAAQTYDPKSSNFTVQIQKLVGTYYIEPRLDEYNEKLKEIKQKKDKKTKPNQPKVVSRENEAKENLLAPIVDFDAIFIPDTSRLVGQVMAFFKSADVTSMTYLGTNLWNTDDIFRRTGLADNNQSNRIFFVDAKNTPEDINQSSFHAEYVRLHQEEPTLLESQAFEVAHILYSSIRNGYTGRGSLADRLRSLGTVKGAYSEIYMNNNQELERPVSILGLEQKLIKKVY